MARLVGSFALKCIKPLEIISFRSVFDLKYKLLNLNFDSLLKMTGTVTLEQLKQRSAQANEVIEKLKKQIEQIKLQTTPQYMAERAKTLEKENVVLKKRVEDLKKELENAEAGKGTGNISS